MQSVLKSDLESMLLGLFACFRTWILSSVHISHVSWPGRYVSDVPSISHSIFGSGPNCLLQMYWARVVEFCPPWSLNVCEWQVYLSLEGAAGHSDIVYS